jgi:hypothetical protein
VILPLTQISTNLANFIGNFKIFQIQLHRFQKLHYKFSVRLGRTPLLEHRETATARFQGNEFSNQNISTPANEILKRSPFDTGKSGAPTR